MGPLNPLFKDEKPVITIHTHKEAIVEDGVNLMGIQVYITSSKEVKGDTTIWAEYTITFKDGTIEEGYRTSRHILKKGEKEEADWRESWWDFFESDYEEGVRIKIKGTGMGGGGRPSL